MSPRTLATLLLLCSTACDPRTQSTANSDDATAAPASKRTPGHRPTPVSEAIKKSRTTTPLTTAADDSPPVKFATSNIQNFGMTKPTDPKRLAIIVETIELHDFVAVQEVADKKEKVPTLLLDAINKDGDEYATLLSPRSGEQANDKSRQELSRAAGHPRLPEPTREMRGVQRCVRKATHDPRYRLLHTQPRAIFGGFYAT